MATDVDSEYGLDDEDNKLLASLDQAPQPDAVPVPDELQPSTEPVAEGPQEPADLDKIAADVELATTPAATTPEAMAPPKGDKTPPSTLDTINAQHDVDVSAAKANAGTADRNANAAQEHDENMRLAYADYLEGKKRAEDELNAKVKELDNARLRDPRESQDRGAMALAVIFGALGSGLAGGGTNQGLETLQKKWHDYTERQKVNIGLLGDKVAMARTRSQDVGTAYAKLRDNANALLVSRYNAAIKQGESQLRSLGVAQADIERDQRIRQLQIGRAAAIAQAQKDLDAHLLNKARIRYYNQGGGHGVTINANGLSRKEQLAQDKEERKTSVHALDALPKDFKTDLNETGVISGTGGAKGLLPTNRSLQKLLKAVDSDNPLSAKEAFLAFDQAARGGTATQGSVDALSKTLGGSETQFKSWLESKKSGGLAPEAKTRFRNAIVEAINSNVSAANDSHQTMVDKYFAQDYYPLKQHVESQFGVFSGFRDAEGKPVFQVDKDPNAPGIDRTTGRKTKRVEAPEVDDKLALAQEAIKPDSGATPEQRKNAGEYIKRAMKKAK
jgi:hypothetical protein